MRGPTLSPGLAAEVGVPHGDEPMSVDLLHLHLHLTEPEMESSAFAGEGLERLAREVLVTAVVSVDRVPEGSVGGTSGLL